MGPNQQFRRMGRATLDSPMVMVYAAVIVTIITILYWLFGG